MANGLYGQLANRDSEAEEGVYLQLLFAVRLSGAVKLDDKTKEEFQTRLQTFTRQYPQSKYLRAVQCPVDAPPEVLLQKMREATGMTDSALSQYQRNENLLKSGEMILPFPIRPQYLLNVCDLLHLWQLAKVSGADDRQYHLVLEGGGYSCKPIDEFNNKTPLIDEVSLLVLNDLGMRWDSPNAEGIMALAAMDQSGQWQAYWNLQNALAA